MRDISPALQAHIENEVISLARCLKITRADGVVLRLTTHDSDLSVNGDTFRADIPLEFSALESTDTLAVDNAEVSIGIDGVVLTLSDIESGAYDNAAFELFIVNWEDTGNGTLYLKKGTLGDTEIIDETYAKFQMRGLTHLLQRPIVERYSLTCRAPLGGKRCGYVNIPTRVRRNNQKVKTFDWFLVPSANVTTPSLSNLDFETSLTGWTVPAGSAWSTASAFTPFDGSQYLLAGAGSVGAELTIYRDLTVTALGMTTGNVDTGDYSIDFAAQIAATSSSVINQGKMFVEQYNSTGYTLRRDETEWLTPDFESWQGVGVTSVLLPGCRTVRVGFLCKVIEGSSGSVAFDAATVRFWTNEASTWGGAAFRTVRLPSYPLNERLAFGNTSFETDGEVGNTNAGFTDWTAGAGDYWRIVSTLGALSPEVGAVFLAGGDNGSTTPAQVYTLTQSIAIPRVSGPLLSSAARAAYNASLTLADSATAANITDGWYYCEIRASVAKTDASSEPRVVVSFLNSVGGVISSLDTDYITDLTINTWTLKTKSVRVPTGTVAATVTLYAKSGATSAANVAFDDVKVYFMPTAFEHADDAELGNLGEALPTYDYTALNYTQDGSAVVQAKPLNFFYGAVTAVTNNRVFTAGGITDTDVNLYSGRVLWLSGNNAGKTSYIRVWNDGTKIMKLYDSLVGTVQIGDKFVYARGCDKTINTCADLFGNAHNFRGEPYLPGPSKVITFLTATN